MGEYRFKYSGDYLTCPHCGKSKKYRNFFDSYTGQPVADGECGTCFSCEFDVRPSQYFEEHPEYLQSIDGIEYTPPPPKVVTYIPNHYVSDNLFTPRLQGQSNLTDFLLNIFDEELLFSALRKYYVGRDMHERILWPQIDMEGNVREIKSQWHNKYSGSRNGSPAYLLHKQLRDKSEIDPCSDHDQCLFGLHLLRNANSDTVACIVESEKTALMFSIISPDKVWLATGGGSNFSLVGKAVGILSDCKAVVVFPDAGEETKWKVEAAKTGLRNITFSKICEGHPHNTDIADLFINAWLTKPQKIEPNLINGNQKQVSPILEKPQVERKSYIIYKAPLFPEPYNYEWLSQEMWDNYLSPECQSAIK